MTDIQAGVHGAGMIDRIAMIDRLAHYLCRIDRSMPRRTEEERWVVGIDEYRRQARVILDTPDGWSEL